MQSLSEFFDENRPVIMDMYIILNAVTRKLLCNEGKNNIIYHIEHIYYERETNTIKFSCCERSLKNVYLQMIELLEQLHIVTKLADDETKNLLKLYTAAFMKSQKTSVLGKYCYDFEECKAMMEVLEIKGKRYNKPFTLVNALFVLSIIIFSVLFYMSMHIKFYM